MKDLNINTKVYEFTIPKVIELLLEKNEMTTLFSGAELGPYEQAMVNRVFGKQFCIIIAHEGSMKPVEAVRMVERTFEYNSKMVDDKKIYIPRGWSAYSLLEQLDNSEHFSTKSFSGKIMKTLERWGYVESFHEKFSIKMFRINGYKTDFLDLPQVSHS